MTHATTNITVATATITGMARRDVMDRGMGIDAGRINNLGVSG